MMSYETNTFPARNSTFPPHKQNWTTFFCSLNFLLSIIGYPLAMALLSPLAGNIDITTGENAFFTYPVRGFQVLIAACALFSLQHHPLPNFSWKMKLLTFFYMLYSLRAFWDLFISPPYHSPFAWAYAPGKSYYFFAYILIETFSLLPLIKGWDKIDFIRVLKWMLILGGIGLIFSAQNIAAQTKQSFTGEIGRAEANATLHTLALGWLGCTVSWSAFWGFFNLKNLLWKALCVVILLLGIFVMLKAGSRAPTLSLLILVCIWFATRSRNFIVAFIIGIVVLGLIFVFRDCLLNLIESVSSTMANRLRMTLESGDISGREGLWSTYWEECLRHPLGGFQLDRLGDPHQMLIDGFMMFGFLFGWIIPFLMLLGAFSAWKAVHIKIPEIWWCFLFFIPVIKIFTSSGFTALAVQAPLWLIFIYEKNSTLLENHKLRLSVISEFKFHKIK